MKRILDNCNNRKTHMGWVVVVKPIGIKGAKWQTVDETFSTTREETRQLRKGIPARLDERTKRHYKVLITQQVVAGKTLTAAAPMEERSDEE